MRRYWSVILLGARGVVGKLLLLLLALTAAEAALVAVFAGYTVILPHILNFSHLSLAFRAALAALAAICCLWGSDIRGGRCAYTLGRLQVDEMTVVVLWGLCYTLAFLVLMGFQLLLILAVGQHVSSTPQTLFLTSHQNELFHALLPMEDWGIYIRNGALALSLGMGCSVWSFWNRRSGAGWSLYLTVILAVIFFPMPTGSGLDGIFLAALLLIITGVGLFLVRKEVRHGEN